jgi:hypothetical protein
MTLHSLVISKQNYKVLSPSFHIHVSVSDLYIPRIGLPILVQTIFYSCDKGLVIELVASFYMIDTMLNVQGDVSVRLGTRDPGTMREEAEQTIG